MGLLRLAAVVLFILAALGCAGLGVHWTTHTAVGVLAAGLACWAASTLTIPQPPPIR